MKFAYFAILRDDLAENYFEVLLIEPGHYDGLKTLIKQRTGPYDKTGNRGAGLAEYGFLLKFMRLFECYLHITCPQCFQVYPGKFNFILLHLFTNAMTYGIFMLTLSIDRNLPV